MKYYIPVALIGILFCSCGSSRVATDSQPANVGSTANTTAPNQLSDTAPALDPNKTEVSRPNGSTPPDVNTLLAPESK